MPCSFAVYSERVCMAFDDLMELELAKTLKALIEILVEMLSYPAIACGSSAASRREIALLYQDRTVPRSDIVVR